MTASLATEAPAAPPAASASAGASPMDAAFIERNQIVERYLSGKLPPRGAADFERFCRQNPDLLTTLGLPERIHNGLRLMDAAGAPEPWAEKITPPYQKPLFIAGLAAAAGTLLIATLMLLFAGSAQKKQIAVLEDTLRNQPLLPVETTRTITIAPARNGPVSRSMANFGGAQTEFADLKFDVSWSRFTNFRVTIDRLDQGRVLTMGNLERDSNGHLRFAINSSALGPGQYAVTMEGLDWRGTPHSQAWANFALTR